MTPVARGTFDQSATGVFRQGRTGDRNRVVTDILFIPIVFTTQTDNIAEVEGYITPFDGLQIGLDWFNEDVQQFRSLVDGGGDRNIRVAVAWTKFSGVPLRPIIPPGESLPAEIVLQEIRVSSTVPFTNTAAIDELLDIHRDVLGDRFTVVIRQHTIGTDLGPFMSQYVNGLDDIGDVRFIFTSNRRWIKFINEDL